MNQKRKINMIAKPVGACIARPSFREHLKQPKGITIIALIITIILMLILAGVGTFVGLDTIKHSRVVKFVSYMQVIQKKVDEFSEDGNYGTLGKSVSESGKQSEIETILITAHNRGEIKNTESNSYRYFNSESLSNDLGIDNIEDEIAINFKEREIVSLNGIEYNKSPDYSGRYYTQYLLPTGQQLINNSAEVLRNLEELTVTKKIDGLSAEITISDISITNGTLSYQEKDTNSWQIINNYTKEGEKEKITLYKSGTYEFKLTDNNYNGTENNEIGEITFELANPPILEEGLTYVKEEYDYSRWNKQYIWSSCNRWGSRLCLDTKIWIPKR